jgi:hypothetical protein
MTGKTSDPCRRKQDVHTAHLVTQPTQQFKITHPFHPLYPRTFKIIKCQRLQGRNYFVFINDNRKQSTVPVAWTDASEEEDAFVIVSAGRSYFRVQDLLRLSDLVRNLQP